MTITYTYIAANELGYENDDRLKEANIIINASSFIEAFSTLKKMSGTPAFNQVRDLTINRGYFSQVFHPSGAEYKMEFKECKPPPKSALFLGLSNG